MAGLCINDSVDNIALFLCLRLDAWLCMQMVFSDDLYGKQTVCINQPRQGLSGLRFYRLLKGT